MDNELGSSKLHENQSQMSVNFFNGYFNCPSQRILQQNRAHKQFRLSVKNELLAQVPEQQQRTDVCI